MIFSFCDDSLNGKFYNNSVIKQTPKETSLWMETCSITTKSNCQSNTPDCYFCCYFFTHLEHFLKLLSYLASCAVSHKSVRLGVGRYTPASEWRQWAKRRLQSVVAVQWISIKYIFSFEFCNYDSVNKLEYMWKHIPWNKKGA